MDQESPVVEVAQSQAAQKAPAPVSTPAAAQPKANLNTSEKSTDFAQFVDHPSLNVSVVLTWTVAIFSIVATLFFWWMNRNLNDALTEKLAEKDTILSQISSKSDIEKKANDFKLSVNQLKIAYSDKYNFTTFTTGLYQKITTDVVIDNISISNDGHCSISGTTKTYRSVADLMVALKSWDHLKDVELTSNAASSTDGVVSIAFSISAKIDKTKQKTNPTDSISSVLNYRETDPLGGKNAEI